MPVSTVEVCLFGWWWPEHDFYFPIGWEFHHPNSLSCFSERLKPPTSYTFFVFHDVPRVPSVQDYYGFLRISSFIPLGFCCLAHQNLLVSHQLRSWLGHRSCIGQCFMMLWYLNLQQPTAESQWILLGPGNVLLVGGSSIPKAICDLVSHDLHWHVNGQPHLAAENLSNLEWPLRAFTPMLLGCLTRIWLESLETSGEHYWHRNS